MKIRPKKNEKAITLIALVVTIVVLLILAGVSISMLGGENGIITQSQNAKLETRGGDVEERVNIWKNENKLNKYSYVEVKTESEFIKDLRDQKLVFDNEIDEENKIIKIGSREIYYGLEENDQTALKFLVNSGNDGIVVLPIYNYFGDHQTIDWGDGIVIDEIASNETKLASKTIYFAERNPNGISHTYIEKNKEYIVTITGICRAIDTGYLDVTKEKIIEILQWGETELETISLKECTNLRKIASPNENSFKNVTSFYETFYSCTGLTGIPPDLFASCPKVTNFMYTFAGCINLTGNAPELWTRGNNSAENYYRGEPDGNYCFGGCNQLSNYDLIPNYWKYEE